MNKISKYILALSINFAALNVNSQAQDTSYLRTCIHTLASPAFKGRGYIDEGCSKAANFIAEQFQYWGLKSFNSSTSGLYFQDYQFNVNTFTSPIYFNWVNKLMTPGIDFLIDAGSNSCNTFANPRVTPINLNTIKDSSAWLNLLDDFQPNHIYLLNGWDSLAVSLKKTSRTLKKQLPDAVYIIPQSKKLIWTVATDTLTAKIIYVSDTSIPENVQWAQIKYDTKFKINDTQKNVIGFVQGTQYHDSFIVFTAHYDHLGKMGNNALFAGANDNASGTSFVLALSKYFSNNPSKYSVVFMMFSGEEAGLLGSKYYVSQPLFPLSKIKTLINIDMMGDADKGITVVNGAKESKVFSSLDTLNKQFNYLPEIRIRDNTANSDHYPFTQKNVSAIFIYANGGKGYYHDVYDRAETIGLTNIYQVLQLLTNFVALR